MTRTSRRSRSIHRRAEAGDVQVQGDGPGRVAVVIRVPRSDARPRRRLPERGQGQGRRHGVRAGRRRGAAEDAGLGLSRLPSGRSLALCGELPNRHSPGHAGRVAVAGGAREGDPVGRNRRRLVAADHQDTAPVDAQRAVLRVHAEQLQRRPAEPMRLGPEPVKEVEGVVAHGAPTRRRQVAARRNGRTEPLDGITPAGDLGREIGEHGAELRHARRVGYSRRVTGGLTKKPASREAAGLNGVQNGVSAQYGGRAVWYLGNSHRNMTAYRQFGTLSQFGDVVNLLLLSLMVPVLLCCATRNWKPLLKTI